MASIEKSLKLLLTAEFGNDPARALEKNPGEAGWTYKGIYQVAAPLWEGWSIIRSTMSKYNNNMALVGQMLDGNELLEAAVIAHYRREFWNKLRLDSVTSQKIADEIFMFAVNVGIRNAVKLAQKLVGVAADGVIGPATINALNSFSPENFDLMFDQSEIKYYESLVEKNPKFKIFLNGWKNRAVFV